MTAYRYVRLGLLASAQHDGVWTIRRSDLERFRRESAGEFDTASWPAPGRRRPATLRTRLARALVGGDELSAWSIVERAVASGYSPTDVYLDLLAPALREIGARWQRGTMTVGDEHVASAVATRLVGRLGPRFVRRGRKRGSVVLGAAPGDPHALPVALLADIVRGAGFHVVDLGADVPIDSFVAAAGEADRLVAVGVSVADGGRVAAARHVVDGLRARVTVPVLVGGPATMAGTAEATGADAWAPDGAAAIALLTG
jgi:methanogenic corrinoid protein MtbC1